MDIRLKEAPFTFDGQEWTLRCNMNVLMDVQEANGGSFEGVLSGNHTAKSVLQLLTAMLNDDALERGREICYTPRQVGRKLSMKNFQKASKLVTELLLSSIHDEDAPEETEKNAQTGEREQAASPLAGT